ncbi:hypothetical protein [Reichenbachiella sp. MSK19-1]|uniref:hypothetical protein n=1 Tax=Reichenbachiella sp. MSK19-1 TaxID=1897631 RepID=UPI000E6B660A|nr:hypothetical protein [Reichenbachiella sp. MSK19-1]RJE74617.1 hypothetical protein BGP76_15870 [Reichenbachiella sp. MSK19-1]
MKNIIKNISNWGTMALFTSVTMVACTPDSEDLSLGKKPEASFTIEPIEGKNNKYLLSNTTDGGFAYYWDKGNGTFEEGMENDTVYLPWVGEYDISLRVLTPGGYDETTESVTVDTADPNACSGFLSLLTDCSSKTWILAQPEGGALLVGPSDGSTWWTNSAADVMAADRVCLFDNEYTFHAQGDFVFDNQGTFRVDDEGGAAWPAEMGLDIGCYDMDQIPDQFQAWGSGNHKFSLTDTHLTVVGNGAHIALYKVGSSGSITTPEASVSYEIVSLTADKMVIKKYFDWGGWVFTLKPKE